MSKVARALLIGAALGTTPGAEAAPVDDARAKAMAWLMLNQRGDGGWQSGAGLAVATTATALDGFANAGVKTFAYKTGLDWLNNAPTVSVDALARQSATLWAAGANATPFLNRLIAMRYPRLLSWGAYDGFSPSLPDTALALDIILRSGISYSDLGLGWCQVLPLQRSDGLWPYNTPGDAAGAVLPTAYAVLMSTNAGKRYRGLACTINGVSTSYDFVTVANKGVTGLLTKQKADGGFGDDSASTVADTALAYLVLRTLRPTDAATTNALNFLLAQQMTSGAASGSWGNDAWLTALVFNALPAPTTALTDTDGDGIPDVVEPYTGTNVNVADSRLLAKSNGQSVTGATAPLALPVATVGTAYSSTLSASGGTSPYTFRLLSGRLPNGLTLVASTGVISGTPTTTGTFAFNYTTDPNVPPTVSRLAQITVKAVGGASLQAAARQTPLKISAPDAFKAAAEVFIAGTSAEAPVVAQIAETLFTPDSLEIFRDDSGVAEATPSASYAAYRGVIRDTGTSLDGRKALIHFRGQGGSPNGVKPVALGLTIERLVIGSGCGPSGTEPVWLCPVAQTVSAVPDLGVADLDPQRLVGPNPAPALSQQQLDRLVKKTPHALVFGAAATNTLDLVTLPQAQAAQLFRGDTRAPELAGLTLCHTEGTFSPPLCDTPSGTALSLRENATVGATLGCLSEAFWQGAPALGLLPLAGLPEDERRWHFVALDGVAPTTENAASGRYPWVAPVTYLWRQTSINGVPKPTGLQRLLIEQIAAKAADPELLGRLSGVAALRTPDQIGPVFDPQRPVMALPRPEPVCRPSSPAATQDNQ